MKSKLLAVSLAKDVLGKAMASVGCFIFVEAPSTGTGHLAIEEAIALNLEPVLFCKSAKKYDFRYDALRVIEVDTDNAQLVVEMAKTLQDVVGIGTAYEFYVETAALAASELGLRSPTPQSAACCRSKLQCRKQLGKVVPALIPPFQELKTTDDVKTAISYIGLPMVIKLSGQAGGGGVKVVRSEKEARETCDQLLKMPDMDGRPLDGVVLAEGYLDGEEYSVETLGETVVAITEKRRAGQDGLIECGHIVPASLSGSEYATLSEAALRALNAIGFVIGAAHVELKLTRAGPKIVEINGRLAGGRVPELVERATGFPYVRSWIADLVGFPSPKWSQKSDYAAIGFKIIPSSGTIKEIKGIKDVTADSEITGAGIFRGEGTNITLKGNNRDRCAWFTVLSNSRSNTIHAIERAEMKIQCVMDFQN